MTGYLILAGIMVMILLMALSDWRFGFLGCVAVGFLQDPLRKLTPGEPVAFVIAVFALLCIVFVLATLQAGLPRVQQVIGRNKLILSLLGIFCVVVFIQAARTLIVYGSPILAGLGLLAYLGPIPALWLAMAYARSEDAIRRMLTLYFGFSLVLAFTVALSYFGVEHALLEEVGEGLTIYDRFQQAYIDAHTGIMRSPEVAAWHLGAAACFGLIIPLFRIGRPRLLLPLVIGIAVLLTALLTGRRKVVFEVFGFIGFFILFTSFFRQHSIRRELLIACAGLVALGGMTLLLAKSPGNLEVMPYLVRGQSVFGDAMDRLQFLGLGAIVWAIRSGGFFGVGAGTGSQGGQHFGGLMAGGASEGGLGKIAVELGIPGLLIFLLLFIALILHVVSVLKNAYAVDRRIALVATALLAFLAANVPIFITASQVFGDPFVLFILGSCFGFILATPSICQRLSERDRVVTDVVLKPS